MAISKDSDDTLDPGQAGKPDLDAWRAEAATCAPLDAAATKGPWRSTWGDDEAADAERGKQGEEVVLESTVLEGHERLVLGTLWHDGLRPCCREEDAAFIAAARTGWPRDAARVAVLAARVAALEVALGEALDEFEDAIQYKLDFLVTKHGDRATIARLRAIAAGTAATAVGEEPTR